MLGVNAREQGSVKMADIAPGERRTEIGRAACGFEKMAEMVPGVRRTEIGFAAYGFEPALSLAALFRPGKDSVGPALELTLELAGSAWKTVELPELSWFRRGRVELTWFLGGYELGRNLHNC